MISDIGMIFPNHESRIFMMMIFFMEVLSHRYYKRNIANISGFSRIRIFAFTGSVTIIFQA